MEEKITKKIRKVGNGTGILLDAKLLFKAELQIGDELEVKCSKNKIVFVKTGKDYEVWTTRIYRRNEKKVKLDAPPFKAKVLHQKRTYANFSNWRKTNKNDGFTHFS